MERSTVTYYVGVNTCFYLIIAVSLIACNRSNILSNRSMLFEGEIEYTLKIYMEDEEVKSTLFGDTILLKVQGNNYSTSTNGKPVIHEYFNSTSGLTNVINDSIIHIEPQKVEDYKVLSSNIADETILGFNCSNIEVDLDSILIQYHYTDQLAADKEFYSKNAIDAVTFCLGQTGYRALKIVEIHKESKLRIVTEAVRVDRKIK